MTVKQIITIVGCILLFGVLYFGCDTKSSDQKTVEMSRESNIEATGIENLLAEANPQLPKKQSALIDAYLQEYKKTEDDSLKVENLINISSEWYKAGYPLIAGYYAEEVAKIKDDKDAWSIAGTTYMIGMRNDSIAKNVEFGKKRAIRALENAISLEEDNVEDQVNLALVYVERPDDNPMQGILMLRELNEKYPDNVIVLNQLAQLAIRTGQFTKAIERLSTALEIEPENKNSICLIAQAYEMSGASDKAEEFRIKCINK